MRRQFDVWNSKQDGNAEGEISRRETKIPRWMGGPPQPHQGGPPMPDLPREPRRQGPPPPPPMHDGPRGDPRYEEARRRYEDGSQPQFGRRRGRYADEIPDELLHEKMQMYSKKDIPKYELESLYGVDGILANLVAANSYEKFNEENLPAAVALSNDGGTCWK